MGVGGAHHAHQQHESQLQQIHPGSGGPPPTKSYAEQLREQMALKKQADLETKLERERWEAKKNAEIDACVAIMES